MYATDALDDALEATREFLFPFEARQWAKLALVALFLGGIGAEFPVSSGGGSGGTGGTGEPAEPGVIPTDPAQLPTEVWLLVGGLIAFAVAFGLAVAAVRAIMDFVLIESLREEQVEIRRFASRRWRQALRLFGFRLIIDLIALVIVIVPLLLVFGPLFLGVGGVAMALFGVLLLIPVLIVVSTGSALLNGLTTVFVVPTMILQGGGVLDGWRRFWPTLRAEWKEYAAYVLVNLLIVVAAGIAVSIGTVIGALLVAVPFLPFAVAGIFLLGVSGLAGAAVLAGTGLLYGVAVLAVVGLVKAPVVTYHRYYALFVLGDTDPDLDPIPERRRLVRAENDPATSR